MTHLTDYLKKLISEMETRLGCRIVPLEDRDIQFPAKLEYARNYARDHHVLRYNPDKCENGYPLFGILLQASLQLKVQPDTTIGVLQPASSSEGESRFHADFVADPVGKKTLAAYGLQADMLEKNLLAGLITQTCNQVLEMLSADIVLRDFPDAVQDMKVYLKAAALEGSTISHEKLREVYPAFIVDTNRILNLMFSMKCGEVCGEKLIDAYAPTAEEIDKALDLYNFYRKEREALKSTGAIAGDVIEHILREVKVDRYAHLIVRDISPQVVAQDADADDCLTEEQRESLRKFYENFGDGKKDSDLMVLGMFKVLRQTSRMPLESLRSLALEIAMLGANGISPARKYTIKNLQNRGEMWGSEVLAYYYVTWAKVFPDKLDKIGLPYKRAYESALAMLDKVAGDNSKKTTRGGGNS